MNSHEDLTRERYQSEDYASTYKAEYTGGWSLKSIRSRVVAYREIKTIEALLEGIGGDGTTLLDIPCGTGKLGALLSSRAGAIVAADVSPQMIELARSEYRTTGVSFLVADATDLELAENSVDVVVCLRLFQRIEADTRRAILDEFRRVCSGDLVISYATTSAWQKVRTLVRRTYDVEKNVFFGLSIDDISAELAASGFGVNEVRHILPGLSQEVIIRASISG